MPDSEHNTTDALMAVSTNNNVIEFNLVGVPTATGVTVMFRTFTPNQPKSYGNTIYVWESNGTVPWGHKPHSATTVNTDKNQSSQKVKVDLNIDTGYIFGYATAPTSDAVVSTIYVPPKTWSMEGKKQWIRDEIRITSVEPFINSLQIGYHGLQNYDPEKNGNWIGLFQGDSVPYYGATVKNGEKRKLPSQSSTYVTMDDLFIGVSTYYAIGYFMVEPEKGRQSLAAQWPFQTQFV